jgi:hypothetical protein
MNDIRQTSVAKQRFVDRISVVTIKRDNKGNFASGIFESQCPGV